MNPQTKRKIKNTARTGGKYALKGVKFAGKMALGTTEVASRIVRKTAQNPYALRLLAKAGTIAACVAFPAPAITLTALNYIVKNSMLGEKTTPVSALMSTFGATERIMRDVLELASIPTEEIARGVEQLAHDGKEALDR